MKRPVLLLISIFVVAVIVVVSYFELHNSLSITSNAPSSLAPVFPAVADASSTALLVGSWTMPIEDIPGDPGCKTATSDTVCDPNDSEELDFEITEGKQTYNSFLHDSPEDSDCLWHLQKGNNAVTISCGTNMFMYHIISLTSTKLVLTDEDSSTQLTYTKLHQ